MITTQGIPIFYKQYSIVSNDIFKLFTHGTLKNQVVKMAKPFYSNPKRLDVKN